MLCCGLWQCRLKLLRVHLAVLVCCTGLEMCSLGPAAGLPPTSGNLHRLAGFIFTFIADSDMPPVRYSFSSWAAPAQA